MAKADVLALIEAQHSALVDAVNSIVEGASPDPLQVQLDAANAKIAELQAEIAKAIADLSPVA